MSVEDTKVSTQIEFLILQTLYLDEDYQRYGFELKNLQKIYEKTCHPYKALSRIFPATESHLKE